MTFHAGFDIDHYPGDAAMAWLKANTPLVWCASYLAPAPNHGDTSWSGRRAALVAAGWGVLPVFVGQQTTGRGASTVTAAQGAADGALAVQLAQAEGFPSGSTVVLDWEDGSVPQPPALGYIGAWIAVVDAAGYAPGLYCSHVLADGLAAAVAPAEIWAWRVDQAGVHPFIGDIRQLQPRDPAGCGVAGASIWQYEQNVVLSLPGTPCDGLCVDLSWATKAQP